MKKGFLLLFAIVALAGVVFAIGDANKVPELDARYSYLVCRVDLVQGQSQVLASYGTFSTDKITSDLAQLKTVADTGDAAAFDIAAKALNDDFKALNAELKDARQAYAKSNLTADERNALRSVWNTTLVDYKACNIDARRSIVSVREQLLQNDIDKWNAVIANLTARGLDTTGLEAVVADAQKLLDSLKNASQITDDTAFKSALNGINDQRLHVWARFAIGRIEANVGRLGKFPGQENITNFTGNISDIKSLLASASAMAASGRRYEAGEFEKTWQDIKDASQQANTLVKDIREYMRNSVQQGIRGRIGNGSNPRNFTGNFTGRRGERPNGQAGKPGEQPVAPPAPDAAGNPQGGEAQ